MLCISISGKAQRVVYYGFQLNPGISWLGNKAPDGLTAYNKKGSYVINFGFSGEFYLSKRVALYSGIQLYGYSFQVNADEYEATLPKTDSEGKSYQRQISGKGISEKSTLQLLHIPVCLMYDFPLTTSIHIFALLGPSFAFPLTQKLTATGNFTYKGYYPVGNYTLENIPMYGFNSDVPVNENNKLHVNILSIHAMSSVGCLFSINRHWKLVTSVNFVRSISNIVKESSGDYSVSNEMGSFHSIMENKGSNLNNFSLNISIQKVLMF